MAMVKQVSQYSRSLIEASLDPLVTISAEGKITDVNTATEQVTGVERADLVGSDFANYFTDPVQAREGYQQVFAKGFVTDYPLAIRHVGGKITDVLYNASVYRDDAGKVLGVFAAARDVTERKKAEELVKQVSQYSRSLIEASLDPLVTISAEGKITDVNTATEQVTGVERADLIGSDFADYFTDPVQAREGYQQVFAKGFVTDYPLAIRHVGGTITDVLYNASVYRDDAGKVLGVFAAARDVTERKKAEERVNQVSQYSRSLIEASLDPLVTISAQGKITDVNTATEQVTGVERADLIGSDFADYFTDPVQAREGYQQVFAKGFVTDYPLAIRHVGGKITDVLYNASVYRDDAGKVLGVFAAARDVTERKEAEERVKQVSQYSRSLIEASLDPLVTISAQGKITDVNTATEQVTGVERADLVGSDFANYFTDPVQAREGYQQVFAKGFVTDYPLAIRHVGGKITDVLYNASVYRDDAGKVLGVFAAARDVTERKKAEELVKQVSQYSRSLIEASLDPLVTISAEGKITDVNTATEQVTGVERADLIGSDFADYFTDPVQAREGYQQVFAKGFVTDYPLAIRHVGGKITDVLYNASVYRDDAGKVLGVFAAARDVTERKKAESLIQAASVFTCAREGIMITNAGGIILNVNDAFTRITEYGREEVLGKSPSMLSSVHQGKDFYTSMWSSLAQNGHWEGEFYNRRKSGGEYVSSMNIVAVLGIDGKIEHYVGLFSDVTAIKEHQNQLQHMAHFDVLTNLPNRSLLSDRLQQAMAQAKRRDQVVAVVYIDLDGFKAINDRYGHNVGDQLLIMLAGAMQSTLREGDTLARIGGDEFVAVLVGLQNSMSCVPMLTRLVDAAAETQQLGNLMLQVSASLGVTFYPQSEDIDADQLLRQADQTMYQAKLSGKNRYHLFDVLQDVGIRSHHESLQRIRKALVHHEFVLHYQPKVNMRTGAVIGAEALIRWRHPKKGLLPPAAFLPVIEDDPLAIEVGEWVIDTALAQMEQWSGEGLDLPVSINVGARQLQQGDFVERLQKSLAKHSQVKPSTLELEVLETSALSDMTHMSQVIEKCAEIGVMFALDDFGTGYSSLTYLKQLRVKQLKLDQSFVRDMLEDQDDLAILVGVIGLAAAFKLQTIAEGVETNEHGTALLKLGCELAQGFGIARPMPAENLPAWATAWRPDVTWVELPPRGGLESVEVVSL